MVEKGLFESFLLCRYYSLLGERGKWSKKDCLSPFCCVGIIHFWAPKFFRIGACACGACGACGGPCPGHAHSLEEGGKERGPLPRSEILSVGGRVRGAGVRGSSEGGSPAEAGGKKKRFPEFPEVLRRFLTAACLRGA
jgi:hypothetical protein